MENSDLADNASDKSILASFAWWEKRRIIFNIVFGACSFYVIQTEDIVLLSPVFVIIFYFFLANTCYCLGFALETAIRYYRKPKRDLANFRMLLFFAGLTFTVIVLLWLVPLLAMPHPS